MGNKNKWREKKGVFFSDRLVHVRQAEHLGIRKPLINRLGKPAHGSSLGL